MTEPKSRSEMQEKHDPQAGMMSRIAINFALINNIIKQHT